MKRALTCAAAASVAVLALTGCSSDTGSGSGGSDSVDAAAAASLTAPEGLIEDGTLTVCIDPEYPPLEYYENGTDGEIVGFDADAARDIASRWGVDYREEVTTFQGLLPGLSSSRCDVIPGGLSITEERLETLDAVAYMNTGPSLAVNADVADEITSMDDVCGRTLATQAATTYHTYVTAASEDCVARGEEPVELTEYPATAAMALAVISGNADALVDMNIATADMASKNDGLEVVEGAFPAGDPIAMYVRKGTPLTDSLREALTAMEEDGTLADLAETYGLDPATIEVG